MGSINAYGGYWVIGGGDVLKECDKIPEELLLGSADNVEIDICDDGPIENAGTIYFPKTGGSATFHMDNVSIDPVLWERMLGTYFFAREAAMWAYNFRKDLFYRCRNNKRTRISKKYYKYIIQGYKDFLRGK